MPRDPHHPDKKQFSLPALYDALSDPVRLEVVGRLADEGELSCSLFYEHGSKTRLSYHFARLREAGLTRVRLEGTMRYISLRRDDLDQRFPGWLDAVVGALRGQRRGSAARSAAKPVAKKAAARRAPARKTAPR